ncbi:MAG: acetate--CoA ligase [Fimbriimonadaceae bacterium]|nr:acetate--CoA ligase [Fimbriimonadaceae bacterium]QYK58366.1 MAG: acetate--CoA ligase [Fimbriimonadaceae bacterium]
MGPTQKSTLQTLLSENRIFAPSADFVAQANFTDPGVYPTAFADPVEYWCSWAEMLDWFERWHTPLIWEKPFAQWFVGGKINACFNCLDRHVRAGRGDKLAFIAEGEPGDVRPVTYAEALVEVGKIANALKALGVKKGDRVCLYMPMVAELPLTMLACARIGAVHSVVFGGFSAESLHERINDAGAKALVTADGGFRRGAVVPLKRISDEALALGCPTIERVLVLERVHSHVLAATEAAKPVPDYDHGQWVEGRDVSWNALVPQQSPDCPCEPMDSEDPLFILYTSGSTGKPKGILHTTGGYLTQTYATAQMVFDLKDSDIYWCTADCGWVTGHSYIVYGPMQNGVTQVIYEGSPDTPDKDRFWQIIERHRVTILYTAPTAIRTFMKWGDEYPTRCDLTSLRLLGSVGEPINPEAWIWYHQTIGGERCPIVDTWWQTETGAIMISPLPGITKTKPGSATQPIPGIRAAILSEEGHDQTPVQGALGYMACAQEDSAPEHGPEVGGILAVTHPWPSMLRGIWGDPERYKQVYWSRFEDAYFPGDGAKVDSDGYFWLLGRIDDVMLVSGHNISTMEVESALVDHPSVAEAAVIGRTHELKGQAIAAFVILRAGAEPHEGLIDEIKAHVAQKIGALARPDDVFLAAELPKTRSGKIMRRLLRDVAEGRVLGDTTTLADPSVVAALKEKYEGQEG